MACERWCFNRGCDEAPRRWLYILFLAFCVLEHPGSSIADSEFSESFQLVAPPMLSSLSRVRAEKERMFLHGREKKSLRS